MSRGRKDTMDIREILVRLRANSSDREIQRELGIDRRTVKRYRVWGASQGFLEGSLPPLEALQALLEETMPGGVHPQNVSSVEPYRTLVEQWVKENVEISAITCRLGERGYTGSYSSVRRFVRRLQPHAPQATVRGECAPGEEAQVDFGYAGKMLDPDRGEWRRAWAFVMLLAWSRHQYVEFVFDQKVETWLTLHRNAFHYFGGVPNRVVLDNLKAAIVRAVRDDPQVQQSYRACAEHYEFLIAPCRPRTPEHKGKVEQGGVHYVKRNFLGGREPTTVTQTNREVLRWCETTAGRRIHGTTKEQPLERFLQTEQARLKPLPSTPYDLASWKQVKLHRDCHVVFDQAYYSAPYRLIGQMLWVCGGLQHVRMYTQDYHLVATHERAPHPGARQTHPAHLPPEKVPGLSWDRETCLAKATQIGTATRQITQTLLDDPIIDRHRTVIRLLNLRDKFGKDGLEAACKRALFFGDPAYATIKRILTQGLEHQPLPVLVTAPPATTFVRNPKELMASRLGGGLWN